MTTRSYKRAYAYWCVIFHILNSIFRISYFAQLFCIIIFFCSPFLSFSFHSACLILLIAGIFHGPGGEGSYASCIFRFVSAILRVFNIPSTDAWKKNELQLINGVEIYTFWINGKVNLVSAAIYFGFFSRQAGNVCFLSFSLLLSLYSFAIVVGSPSPLL